MLGHSQINDRVYGQQPGLDWGKIGLYGAGAATAYGVGRGAMMKAGGWGKKAWNSEAGQGARNWGSNIWKNEVLGNGTNKPGMLRSAWSGPKGGMGAEFGNWANSKIAGLNTGRDPAKMISQISPEGLAAKAGGFFSGANAGGFTGGRRALLAGARGVGAIAGAGLAISAARGAWNMFD